MREASGRERSLSWIIWLGDFIGGALVFDDGRRIEEKYTCHQIDGRVYHWNEPHEGTKCSIILYHSNKKSKSSRMVERRRSGSRQIGTPMQKLRIELRRLIYKFIV